MFVVPLMIFLGLPATSANASLRPAIAVQNIVALLAFRRSGLLDRAFVRKTTPLVLVAVPAALIAAHLVTTRVRDDELEHLIALVFIVLAVFMACWRPHSLRRPHRTAGLLLIAGAGFYGGFLQIGVGFLLITALLLGGPWEMAKAHAAKISIVLFYTLCSLPVFIMSGQIDWVVAGVLATGQGAGGYLGSRFATQVDEVVLKRIYIALMIVFAVILIVR